MPLKISTSEMDSGKERVAVQSGGMSTYQIYGQTRA